MDTINQVKQALNITDVIGTYIELKKSGRNYKGVCPFHAEKTPSFMVSPELQMYKCFGCNESGDIFTFIQKIEGIEFGKALELLAEKAGIKVEKQVIDPKHKEKQLVYEMTELATKFYEYLLVRSQYGKPAEEYLKKKRKLKAETIREFRLGYAPNDWDSLCTFLRKKGYTDKQILDAGLGVTSKRGTLIDKFRHRLVFPLIDADTRVVGFSARAMDDTQQPKYLNSPETSIFHKSNYLYGLDKAKVEMKHAGAILVEGQVDVLSAHQEGIKNVIASSGTALTSQQLKIIKRFTSEVAFCFDADTAGQNAIMRALELAEPLELEIKVIQIPKPYKDLDELIKNDLTKAKNAVNEKVSIYDFFIAHAFRNNESNTALGKKNIIAELAPKFVKVKNKVIIDHYTKLVAEELNIDYQIVKEAFESGISEETPQKGAGDNQIPANAVTTSKNTPSEYILALLLASKLDFMQNILYKLGKKDFKNDRIQQIFILLKEYVLGRKRKIDVNYFINTILDEPLRPLAQDILLIDISEASETQEKLEKEINRIFTRVKKETISQELEELKKKIKQAEIEKDSEEIEELSKQVYKFTKLKLQYDKK